MSARSLLDSPEAVTRDRQPTLHGVLDFAHDMTLNFESQLQIKLAGSRRHKADAAVSELLALKLTLTPAPTGARSPLWDGCDAQAGKGDGGVQDQPQGDHSAQSAPDDALDQRVNW